jgi:hypothetical protein
MSGFVQIKQPSYNSVCVCVSRREPDMFLARRYGSVNIYT